MWRFLFIIIIYYFYNSLSKWHAFFIFTIFDCDKKIKWKQLNFISIIDGRKEFEQRSTDVPQIMIIAPVCVRACEGKRHSIDAIGGSFTYYTLLFVNGGNSKKMEFTSLKLWKIPSDLKIKREMPRTCCLTTFNANKTSIIAFNLNCNWSLSSSFLDSFVFNEIYQKLCALLPLCVIIIFHYLNEYVWNIIFFFLYLRKSISYTSLYP